MYQIPDLKKCPRTLLVCEKSNFDDEHSRFSFHVSQHTFNHKVSLLIPECSGLHDDGPAARVDNLIKSFNKYYLIKNLAVHELLEKDFLEKVIHNGAVYALSYNTRIDEDNTVALFPHKLVLSVDKDTYEQLGLEGKPSQYNHRRPMRYVTIDLTVKSMIPGGKVYQRVLSGLKERVPLRTHLLLAWRSSGSDGNETLQSLLSRYETREYESEVIGHTLRDLPCPALHSADLRGDQSSCDPAHFLEWLGAVNADVGWDNTSTSFLSTYVCPEPRTPVSKALRYTITGFLLPEDILALLEELRRYLAERGAPAWLAMTVHGFTDSPVSWGLREHGFHMGGENFYNFVLFQNQDYWLHMGTGAHDECPP